MNDNCTDSKIRLCIEGQPPRPINLQAGPPHDDSGSAAAAKPDILLALGRPSRHQPTGGNRGRAPAPAGSGDGLS